MDFDNDGEWNNVQQKGPAVHAPLDIKNIPIMGYRVEWLNMSKPEENFYAKNHMVAMLAFTESKGIGKKTYKAARISMELSAEKKVAQIVGQKVGGTQLPT